MASQTTINGSNVSAPVLDAAQKKLERRKRFEAVFPLIKQELLEYLDECKMPSDARDWFDRVRDIPVGCRRRALAERSACLFGPCDNAQFQNLEYNTPGGEEWLDNPLR